jgi:hypothetical protein
MERSPEQKLFLTVIVQATHDAAYTGHNKYLIMHKRDAINWLTGNSKDFQIVCKLAKIDPYYATHKFVKAMKLNVYSLKDSQFKVINKKKPYQLKNRSGKFKLVF